MSIALSVVLLIIGLVLVGKGGDWLVVSAVKIAKVLQIPMVIIGATIVSIGTTLPELLTSIMSVTMARTSENPTSFHAIAIGNSIGSILCNSGLVLGLVVAIRPPKFDKECISKGIFLVLTMTMVTIFFMVGDGLTVWKGIALLITFVIYFVINLISVLKVKSNTHQKSGYKSGYDIDNHQVSHGNTHQKSGYKSGYDIDNHQVSQVNTHQKAIVTQLCSSSMIEKITSWTIVQFLVGVTAIALGAYLLADNAQYLCQAIGISPQIVGVTVVAIGTSIPELVTSVIAMRRGECELGIGNVIGANIINGCLLLGSVGVISEGIVIDQMAKMLTIFALMMAFLILLPSIKKKKMYRIQGLLLLTVYIGLIIANIVGVMS